MGEIVPRGSRCPECGYDLTGLLRPVCPECGHALSKRDFQWFAYERWRLGELRKPANVWLNLSVLAALVVVLWASSGMFSTDIALMFMGALALLMLGVRWGYRVCMWIRLVGMAPSPDASRWRSWAIAPAIVVICAVLVLLGVPREVRWRLSAGALEAAALRELHTPEGARARFRPLTGLYIVDRAERTDGGVLLHAYTSDDFTLSSPLLFYAPNGLSPRRSASSPIERYEHWRGPWHWAWPRSEDEWE